MLKVNKKRLITLWQLIIVAACFSTIVMLFVYSTQLNKFNHKMLHDQTAALSRVLLRQAGNSAFEPLKNKQYDKLQDLVDDLEYEPLILDASIYNLQGETLAHSKDAMPLEQLTGLNTPLSVTSIGRQQLVEPILDKGNLLGFVRITLEHGEIIQESANRLEQNINLIRSMLLLALVTGALLIFTVAERIELWFASLTFKNPLN